MWLQAALFLALAAMPSWIWLGVVAAFLWMLGPVYNVVQFSYRVALIPDELQGRVNSTFRLLAFGFIPVGAALAGFAIEYLGVTATVVLFAAWLAVLAILTTLNSHVRDAVPIERAKPREI
jgi:predicted MFS family arabinose efflux permease